jgi:exodeoxyribonuclease V alpha subunit
MEQLFGYIERITFTNSENGFTVAKLKLPRKKELITIVGFLPSLQTGETVRCQGYWKINPVHGSQFHVEEFHTEKPQDLKGIQKYLESGMVKGIGPIYAKKIVQHFGIKTLEIIDKNPYALKEVEGIGEKRVEKIQSCWASQKKIREVMIFLQKYQISPLFAQKIYKIYGDEAISRIQENPFELARNIRGVGFKKADQIAERMGFEKTCHLRLDSGIEYVLNELSEEGHVCYPLQPFLQVSEEILGVEKEQIRLRIDALSKTERIFFDEDSLWIKRLYLCEMGIARELFRLVKASTQLRKIDVMKAIAWAEQALHLSFALAQKEAIQKALQEKILIITGGPGTGKSTIIKAILAITEKLTRKITLAAPTGRAAKRMTEITHRAAFTIHSLLQYDFVEGGFRRNRENPIDADLIIIDESSMIDTSLMYHLLKAVPTPSRIIFVGDIHQLPSVGPGNILKDLIESEKIPIVTLKEIFRQAAGSQIIINAHKINQGEFPFLRGNKQGDFFFIRKEAPEEILNEILDLVSVRLPKRYRFDPVNDIQILAPMKKGIIGTENLNQSLQKKLNSYEEQFQIGGNLFSPQDKVMQIKNNYNKEIYNGDIGRILRIHREDEEVTIAFDGKEICYAFHEMDEVVLAYATSIHKYQGSESPCVVIPVHTSHFALLHRNLLYTAVTRGKRLVILVGSPKAIAIAVRHDEVKSRYTQLKFHIKNLFKE